MKNNKGFLFVLPAVIFLLVFSFIPFLNVFSFSFLDYNLISDGEYIGLENYKKLFSDSTFWQTLLNSFIFILTTPVLIVLSLGLAVSLREKTKMNRFFNSVFFFPVITPLVIAGIIWRWILAEDYGLLNYLLSLVGISNIKWLSEYPVNLLSIMILTIWRGFGYYLVIFLSGLMVLSKEIEEAAKIDGAGKFQIVYNIIVPQIKPIITFVFVVSSASAIKMFTELYILIPGTPMANKSIVYYLFREAFERFDFGISSAAGVVIFIISFAFSYINIKLLEKNKV